MCQFCNHGSDDTGLPCCCHELEELYRADAESNCPEAVVVFIISAYVVLLIILAIVFVTMGEI